MTEHLGLECERVWNDLQVWELTLGEPLMPLATGFAELNRFR